MMVIDKECKNVTEGAINTHDDSCYSNSVITKCLCDKKYLLECENKNIGCGDIYQLLREIEECCCSKHLNDPTKNVLEQSRITIFYLIKEIETHNSVLKYYIENFECCSQKLSNERVISQNKDFKLLRRKTDLTLMVDNYQQTIQQNQLLNCSLDEVSENLLSRTIANNELSMISEELKEELKNMNYCLNMSIDENKCIKRELNEKCQIIEAGVIIKQELELKLIHCEKRLEESEKFNHICNFKTNDLITKNIKLENDLKNEKNSNSKKAILINDLSKQINNLETIIKGLEGHKMLYTEELSNLRVEKCATQLKLNEFISMIDKQKNELVIIKCDLVCAEESLKNKNTENACLIQKMQQLKHENENFEIEMQCYKSQHDFLMNKSLLNDQDLLESQNCIKSLEIKINEIMREYEEIKMIKGELSEEVYRLTDENCKLVEKINELNESLVYVNEMENQARKDLATSNEKLTIANDEISYFDLEIKCLSTKLEKMTDKLICVERELEDNKLKLYEEKYCRCLQEKCQTAENNRLSNENLMSCKIARIITEGVQTVSLELVDVGLQTHMCPVIYQPIPTLTNCDSEFHSIPNNSNLFEFEQCDTKINILRPCENCNNCISPCDSDKISISPCQSNNNKMSFCVSSSENYSCSGESKNTTKCFDFLFDKENLQCQLSEMKLLLKRKENAAKKEICDTELRYNNNKKVIKDYLEETKEQYEKKLDEANCQMETYETAIMYKEYELKNSQIREQQYKIAMEQLKETIQSKDKKFEYEKQQVVSLRNSMNDCKEQLTSLQKTLELDKSNEHKSDEKLQSLTNDDNVQHEKDSELENKLETSQKDKKEQRYTTKKNVDQSACAKKKSKMVPELKRKNNGVKFNLPCCIGSKNPCSRQKLMNLSKVV